MGVIKRGILGGFSGSVGNVVGSSWKGIATMKAKPLSVANPNTAAQIAQRTKMSNIVLFASKIVSDIIKPLNDRFASGMSGYNLFVQRNIALFASIFPSTPENLILSKGNVEPVKNLAATADVSDGKVTCTWDNNTGDGNALADDLAYFIVQNTVTSEVLGVEGAGYRSDGSGELLVPGMVAGQPVKIWFSFRRSDGSQVSDSTYITVNAQA